MQLPDFLRDLPPDQTVLIRPESASSYQLELTVRLLDGMHPAAVFNCEFPGAEGQVVAVVNSTIHFGEAALYALGLEKSEEVDEDI